jgi:septation ring formation regulator EzrA
MIEDPPDEPGTIQSSEIYLRRIAMEMKQMRQMMASIINAIREAESEIPEKMRRFTMYAHDVHAISYMYEERGLPIPDYVMREMERCDDRYRQLLKDLHLDGGAFEKVRREMAEDPENRWDHTRQLAKPKEAT